MQPPRLHVWSAPAGSSPGGRFRLSTLFEAAKSDPWNPSTSSAAASPAPRRPGRSPAPACRRAARDAAGSRHRRAQDRRAGRARLLQFLPLRRCATQRRRPAARGDAPRRFADHAPRRRAPGAGRRRARRRPRRICGAVTATLEAHPLIDDPPRGNRRPAAGRLGQRHHRHRPADLAGARPRPSAALTGEDALAFFDAIAPIVHRDTIDMDIAWFQSRYDKAGPGGTGADYINCPMTREHTKPSSTRCSPARRPSSTNWEDDALFRRLPADRGHGRARPRDVAPRADEAGRPDQRARAGSASPMRSSSCGRTMRSARSTTSSASRRS